MNAPAESGGRVGSDALAVLRQHGGKWGSRAATALVLGQMVAPHAKRASQKLRRRDDFTIAVAGTEDVYPELHEWVLAHLPESERKALIATTESGRSGAYIERDSYESGRRREPPKVRLRYDGQREQAVVLDGHRIKVTVIRDDVPGGRERLPENWRQLLETIRFTASNAAGRDAVVRMLDGLLAEKYREPGPPPLLIPSKWGGSWNRRGDLPPRTLDSVVLKAGQLERLVADLGDFLAAEVRYGARCLPWHRGYLFHGEPGTGKTSVARALANQFEIPTYYLPLADLERDADLMGLVGAIQPRSMLLLEDVDSFHAATDREEKQGTASVAAMLNALDGVWTPHGLITVMTTNHREALDSALLRAGRVDVDEEFTALDEDQAARIFDWLGISGEPWEFVGRSPAEMVRVLTGRERRVMVGGEV